MSRKDLADESALEFSRVFDFSGRVVLITGAVSGIGKAIAELFSERGAQLALIDKSPHIESVASALGREARSWEADIVEDAQVERIVGEIVATLGRIDVLVNNAAETNSSAAPIDEMPRATWLHEFDVNVHAPFTLIGAVLPHMRKLGEGLIVNITSGSVRMPIAGLDLSSGARAGLTAFLAGVARNVAASNVTINFLLPGMFDTDRLRSNTEAGATQMFSVMPPPLASIRPVPKMCSVRSTSTAPVKA